MLVIVQNRRYKSEVIALGIWSGTAVERTKFVIYQKVIRLHMKGTTKRASTRNIVGICWDENHLSTSLTLNQLPFQRDGISMPWQS